MSAAVRVEISKCSGCKLCIYNCPEPNVIKYRKEDKKVVIDAMRCKACLLCVAVCPKKALEKEEA